MSDNSTSTVTLMAGGDIGPVSGPTEKFAELITPVLRQADLRFGQCERTYSKRGWEPQYSYGPGGQLTRLDPGMAEVWKAANMDVISVASNHAMDWGVEAMLEGVDLVKAGKAPRLDGAKAFEYPYGIFSPVSAMTG